MELSNLPVKTIKKLKRIQPRFDPDPERIGDFAELLMEDPAFQFEPIVVFRNPRTDELILSDGWTRHGAYEVAERHLVPCDVREGDEGDAYYFALQANCRHGHPLTREELVAAILAMWDHRNRGEATQVDVAKLLGCSLRTVGRVLADRKSQSVTKAKEKKERKSAPVFSAEAMEAINRIGECNEQAKIGILNGSIKKPEDELIAFSAYECDQQLRLAPYFFTSDLNLKAAINSLAKRPNDLDLKLREYVQYAQLRGVSQSWCFHDDTVEVTVTLLTETPAEQVVSAKPGKPTKPASVPVPVLEPEEELI